MKFDHFSSIFIYFSPVGVLSLSTVPGRNTTSGLSRTHATGHATVPENECLHSTPSTASCCEKLLFTTGSKLFSPPKERHLTINSIVYCTYLSIEQGTNSTIPSLLILYRRMNAFAPSRQPPRENKLVCYKSSIALTLYNSIPQTAVTAQRHTSNGRSTGQ